jgi:hypothetical protein
VNSITISSSSLSFESAGKNTVTNFLNNTNGSVFVDGNAGEGGTTLNIGGTLTNGSSITNATLTIGNTTLSASDKVTAASLSNGSRSTINVTGSTTAQALLDVTGAAGFGAAGVLTGFVFLGTAGANDKSAIEFGSGQITSLANSAQLHLFGNQAFIEDSTTLGKNSALSGLASIGTSATFELGGHVAVSTTGALANNRGTINLDQNFGDGGSTLTVAGALTNSGTINLGTSSLSSKDSITASSFVNTGTINLTGSASNQALLNITGAAGFGAAGTLTGTVNLVGDSAIEFGSGQIARIAAQSFLTLSGNSAFIEVGTSNSDSALKGLANVAGSLEIDSNVSLTTTGALLDTGTINLVTAGGSGGLTLSLGGALSIGGSLSLGNTALSSSSKVITTALNLAGAFPSITLVGAGSNQALINVTGGTAGFGVGGVLTGTVSLTGNTAIEFKSGTISTIAGSLTLNGINSGINGNNALIEDSTALGSNSALNIASVSGTSALLSILNGESVSVIKTTGNPTGSVNNSGTIAVDSSGGHGSSKLNIAGRLTNLGTFVVGNASLTSGVQATVGSLANVGSITVAGATAASNQALIDVTGVAGFGTTGIVSGSVSLSGDSAIEFASGQITSVGLGATLHLNGSKAFIEDGTSNSNSALQGLSNVVGTFSLDNFGSVSTTGALINDGLLELDVDGSSGSSTLSVKTGLTNNGTLVMGNFSLSGSDKMTVATLSSTGTIKLNGAGSSQALLDVTTGKAGFGTAGTLTGSVTLTQDSAIEFASGQINTIGAGSQLTLNGNNAFIEDLLSNSNSALTGLATVAGSFNLDNGASVSTTGAVVDSGLLSLDFNVSGAGGSTLTIAGGLTDTGTLDIGSSGLASSDSVTVKTFTNSGTVNLTGNSFASTDVASLNVSGTTTNNGSIVITTDTETLAGAVSGAGSFSLTNSFGSFPTILQFGSSVSAGQTINEIGTDELILKQADKFAATISGFGINSGSTFSDTIDAANFLFSGTTLGFKENSANTGGTLTLTNGSLVAHILMTGSYSNSSFSLGHDSGNGTLVTFV